MTAGRRGWLLRALAVTALLVAGASPARAEDGYDLWLRYRPVADTALLRAYRAAATQLVVAGRSPTLLAARDELRLGLRGLLGADVPLAAGATRDGAIIAGTPAGSPAIAALGLGDALRAAGDEGYVLRAVRVGGRRAIVIAANRDVGVLYGAFRLLRQLQTHGPLDGLAVASAPRVRLRVLNHWDNLDRSVERGYAGRSLWAWDSLPGTLAPRYRDYARANASLGINGAVLTNVNANARVLTPAYLEKVKALAGVLRPYGVRVFLTARFSAPVEIGGLKTADPLDPAVRAWWKAKADEIYGHVPDFGGFLVKANSEGQPGPQDYKRTHADGANMLADAVAPHGGVVMWRAFVYSNETPTDRVKQAYDEFKPLDGTFRENVLVQVKNGPLDFQPREPFSPLFGAMPKTPLVMELQITKEYLGQDTHLAWLGPYFEEVLDADTYAAGRAPPSRGRRRVAARLRADRDRRRVERRHGPRLDGLALQPGELVRVRPPRVGPGPRRGGDRARVGPHDLRERLRGRGARRGDDDDVAGRGGALHDAARPHPHHGHEPPLRPGRMAGRRRARRLDARVLPPRGHAGPRLRPHGAGERRGGAVLPRRARPVRQPRLGAAVAAALVPPRRLGRAAAVGAHPVGRAGARVRRGRGLSPGDAAGVGLAPREGRRRAVRRRAGVPGHPGDGGPLVARRDAVVLPDVLADAVPRRPRAAGASARLLPPAALPARPRQATLRRAAVTAPRAARPDHRLPRPGQRP
jgi:hypothetical protein